MADDTEEIVVDKKEQLEKIKRFCLDNETIHAVLDLKVSFTGMVAEPQQELERGDIFLYYSNHDNFPNTILEAMSCGLPVITNDIGAINEIIENGKDGYISDDYNAVVVAVSHKDYMKFDESYFKSITNDNAVFVDVKGIYRDKIKEMLYWSL